MCRSSTAHMRLKSLTREYRGFLEYGAGQRLIFR